MKGDITIKPRGCSDPDLSRHCSGCTDSRSEGTHAGCTIEHGHVGCDLDTGKGTSFFDKK